MVFRVFRKYDSLFAEAKFLFLIGSSASNVINGIIHAIIREAVKINASMSALPGQPAWL